MVILVTGGAGFIGSHLVEALSKLSISSRVVDCFLEDSYNSKIKKYIGKI